MTEITLSSLPIFIPLTPLVDLPIGRTSPSANLIAFPDSDARHTSSFPSVIMVPINLSPSSRLIALKPGAYFFSKAFSAVFFTTPLRVAMIMK